MRLLVCGSREWRDYRCIYDHIVQWNRQERIELLIEGGARGADSMARAAASSLRIPFQTVRAEWDMYGRAAGSIRNQRMIDEFRPTEALAFWDGQSSGTRDMIRRLQNANIPTSIILPAYPITQ